MAADGHEHEHTSRWRVVAKWEVANELGADGPDRPDEGTFGKFARRERLRGIKFPSDSGRLYRQPLTRRVAQGGGPNRSRAKKGEEERGSRRAEDDPDDPSGR